jgi:putative transposase
MVSASRSLRTICSGFVAFSASVSSKVSLPLSHKTFLTDGSKKSKALQKHWIMDRDAKFSESFRFFLSSEGVEPVRLPPRSPNIIALLERFFGSLKSECLGRLILFGERSMRYAVKHYLERDHAERPHQGLGNELIVPMQPLPSSNTEIETNERLGGLL